MKETTREGLTEVLRELREALEDHSEGSVTRLVRKALMLASLSRDSTYEMLFEIHLLGIRGWEKGGNKEVWRRKGVEDNEYVASAHVVDRLNANGTAVDHRPLDEVERMIAVLRDFEKRYAGDSTAEDAASFMKDRLESEAILGRIRARVTLFAAQLHQAAARYFEAEWASTREGTKIFIGHGHSGAWRTLADFLGTRLGLAWDEFNRESTAGIAVVERLQQMLNDACFGFLVMTAEDLQRDGSARARQNVIHEAGLFQGRLGFRRAIILLEEGCAEFSNVFGLGQIRFPRGNIMACAEDVRRVLEREGVLETRV